ncbi:DUF808 domain-containing protein [Acidimangrovimonas pyrenivorans]|uniref:DUF808 domain-containing protein n=1 Tax=Acidimangrovimonas pyrenivorans TaxID=2030798 RepID=A0ABV7AD50_9RHOB
MSGLLALLDDVATIAKVAATSVDDIAGQAAKAGAKAAGAVIDDAAVTPRYLHGFPAARELPIVGRIAMGSVRNKLVILLPLALLLSAFAPGAIQPLLMLGGLYLSYEGAEKLAHAFSGGGHAAGHGGKPADAAHLEEAKVAGAIKTDFILSAEIMTIILAALPKSNFWYEAGGLALAGLGITAVVYGGVALIVKADDVGLYMAQTGRFAVTRRVGRAVVRGMPHFLTTLANVGTAAMLWVGGAIIVHGLESFGLTAPGHVIETWAEAAAHLGPEMLAGTVHWTVTAVCDGAIGVVLGFVLLPVVGLAGRGWRALRGQGGAGH